MANRFTRFLTSFKTTDAKPQTKIRIVRGAYAGAAHNRLNMDWNASLESADLEGLRDLTALRGRSRDLVKNNAYAARFVELCSVNVIGSHGISVQTRVRNSLDELDATINETLQNGFTEWGKSATIDGKLTWLDVQQLAIKTVVSDGEVFIRKINGAPNAIGFALQMLDADYLDHTYNRVGTTRQLEIRQGIEIDEWGTPVAYHFWKSHPSEGRQGQKRVRVPADEIIHLYRPTRPNQSRGIPWTAPAMGSLKLLGEYLIAELVAARTGAAKMGFIRTGIENANPYLDEELEVGGVDGREVMEANPGTITRLDPGDEFQDWSPNHPSTAFDNFTKCVLRGVAASLNVSYSALTYDLGSENYSSGRIGLLHERDYWRNIQQLFIRILVRPVYEAWLEATINAKVLPLPLALEEYTAVEFRPRGFTWVDPAKEFAAHEKGIALGLTSRTKIASEIGADIQEIFRDLDRENQLAVEFGININGNKPASVVINQGTQTEDNNEK